MSVRYGVVNTFQFKRELLKIMFWWVQALLQSHSLWLEASYPPSFMSPYVHLVITKPHSGISGKTLGEFAFGADGHCYWDIVVSLLNRKCFQVWFQNRRTKWRKKEAADNALGKRQEDLKSPSEQIQTLQNIPFITSPNWRCGSVVFPTWRKASRRTSAMPSMHVEFASSIHSTLAERWRIVEVLFVWYHFSHICFFVSLSTVKEARPSRDFAPRKYNRTVTRTDTLPLSCRSAMGERPSSSSSTMFSLFHPEDPHLWSAVLNSTSTLDRPFRLPSPWSPLFCFPLHQSF